MTAFKLLSLLLSYPDDELLALRDDIAVVARDLPPSPAREAIVAFADEYAAADGFALQRRYVETFDFTRRGALHLSYWSHGDRRQRGVALLQLKRLYAQVGLEPLEGELPDHLPLLLEAADLAGPELLMEFRAPLELIRAFLEEEGSAYAPLLDALCALLGPLGEEDAGEAVRLAAEGPPTESVGLEPFGPPEAMPA